MYTRSAVLASFERSRIRLSVLLISMAVLGGVRSANACKLDGPHLFEVATIQPVSFKSDVRITSRVVRWSSFPLAPCALQSMVEFRVEGLPTGRWGLLFVGKHSGRVPVPSWPMALAADGTAVVSWPESLGIWRSGLDESLEVSIIDATGKRSAAQFVKVVSTGRPQFLTWVLLLGLAGLYLWRRSERRRESMPLARAFDDTAS
jgi:hypothetical protein